LFKNFFRIFSDFKHGHKNIIKHFVGRCPGALNFLDGHDMHNVEFYTFKYDPEVFGLNPTNSIRWKIKRFTGIALLM
jgi:hypothetical protein